MGGWLGGGWAAGSYSYYLHSTGLAMRAVSLLQTRHGLPSPRSTHDPSHSTRQDIQIPEAWTLTLSRRHGIELVPAAVHHCPITDRGSPTCSAAPPVGSLPSKVFFLLFSSWGVSRRRRKGERERNIKKGTGKRSSEASDRQHHLAA